MSESRRRPSWESTITGHECRAIRELDRDDDYTRSEIAFMFETTVGTVARHADSDCHHQGDPAGPRFQQAYSDEQLLTAYRVVYDRQSYQRMSQSTYERNRPEDYPSHSTITQRFGSWPAARAAAMGGDDGDE